MAKFTKKTVAIVETPILDTLPTQEAILPLTDTAPAIIPEEPSEEPQEPAYEGPTLYVDSPIKKALFDLCIRPEFEPGGKWGGKSQANLAAIWKTVRVVVDPTKVGRDFEAQKTNWNVNDSNWTNPPANYTKLSLTASMANEGVSLPKKALIGHLEDLKAIFSKKAA